MKYVVSFDFDNWEELNSIVQFMKDRSCTSQAAPPSAIVVTIGDEPRVAETPAKKPRAPKKKETVADVLPPAPLEEKKKLTFEEDIIPAFQAYAKRNSRDAAIKVLEAYNVKSVRELPPNVFEEVLEKLS